MGRRAKFPGNRESFASGLAGPAEAGGFARVSVKFPTREQGISGARAGSGSAVSVNVVIGSRVLESRIRTASVYQTNMAILASPRSRRQKGLSSANPCRHADWPQQ